MIIYTDGASRGNPGPAAAAFVLTDDAGNQIRGKASFLGKATNNIAEYTALLNALTEAQPLDTERVTIFSDSELMVQQINGTYRVKNPNIREIYLKCTKLLDSFGSWEMKHIRREKNAQADALANEALDQGRDIEHKPDRGKAKSKKTRPLRLGILLSGGGTTMINILEHIQQGKLNAEISLVISSRSTVGGVEKAKKAELNVKIIRKKDYNKIEEFSEQIRKELLAAKVELVIQAGWLCLWHIPAEFTNRVMNIHPALLPSFGGQGMWGHNVHKAVLKAGCKISGCTVHFCTNEYDAGAIIVQRSCPVESDDDADILAARVFQQECIAYPEAINLFEQKRISVNRTVVNIKPKK